MIPKSFPPIIAAISVYKGGSPTEPPTTLDISRTFSRSFANFLSGQCGEAVILGTLMFLAFAIFKLPYGSLVGVLTAVCAIIPYVGQPFCFRVKALQIAGPLRQTCLNQ